MSATRSCSSWPTRYSRHATLPALAAQAPLLWDEAPGNLSYRFGRGDKPAVDAAFAAAAHTIEIELVNNRLVVAPIEPRAAIGTYDAAADRFDLLLTGQGVHSLRQQLAEVVFNMPLDRITVRAPDVGGGFGVKNFLYPEWVLVPWAARRLGLPVKCVAERGDEFISSSQGRDNHTRGRLALDRDGRFLALDVDTVANLGAYLSTNGPGSSTNSPASAMGGVYDIPAVFMAVRGVFTNTVPIRCLSRRRQARSQLPDRAARRSGRAPARTRPGRVAPAQSNQPLPVSQRSRGHDRLRTFRRQSRRDGATRPEGRLC
jgi:aerobic carbon-monoxide dehydrogenase large subunit